MNTIYLECITTGDDPKKDELLRVTIVDDEDTILFDDYFKPSRTTDWDDSKHHTGHKIIDTQGLNIEDCIDEITRILLKADNIVGSKAHLDIEFLKAVGVHLWVTTEIHSILDCYNPIMLQDGTFNDDSIDRYTRILNLADYYDYEWQNWGKCAPPRRMAFNTIEACRIARLVDYEKLKSLF